MVNREVSEVSKLALTDGVSLAVTYGDTNRSEYYGKNRADVLDWSQCETQDAILEHNTCRNFKNAINEVSLVHGKRLDCFRFRVISVDKSLPRSTEMGPPPIRDHAQQSGGRYDRPGQPVLYLTSSERGARREAPKLSTNEALFIQQFAIPLINLKIADFSELPEDNLVTSTFAQAERCCVSERSGPDTFLFSRLVAEITKEIFDGMKVPGVRGEPGGHYHNIVIFDPFPNWTNWLVPNTTPYRLGH